MPTFTLTRLLIHAEYTEAEQLVKLLTAVTGAEPPVWTNRIQPDRSYRSGTDVRVGDAVISVRIAPSAVPHRIEIMTDVPLVELRGLVADTLGAATAWPNDPDAPLAWVGAHIGEGLEVLFMPASAAATEAVTA